MRDPNTLPPPPYHNRLAPRRVLLVATFLVWFLTMVWAWPKLQARVYPEAGKAAAGLPEPTQFIPTLSPTVSITTPGRKTTDTASPTPTASLTPTQSTTTATAPSGPGAFEASPLQQGLIVLASREDGYSRLFAYRPDFRPGVQPLIRLTSGDWNDITPAISPDGLLVAFSSDRSGNWDLYLLDLATGNVQQVTDTPEYDGNPTFSPDGLWLAYESYQPVVSDTSLASLDVYILSLEDSASQPIPLTDSPSADYAPAWSPLGRHVAFVSDRTGESEIWLAALDQYEGRFTNLSRSSETRESHPNWSFDGQRIAWSTIGSDGMRTIVVHNNTDGGSQRHPLKDVGSGSWPVWSPDGETILTGLVEPNANYLTGYYGANGALLLPPFLLAGALEGLAWGSWGDFWAEHSTKSWYASSAATTPEPLWLPALGSNAGIPGGRQTLVELAEVQAPSPQLHDMVDEAFSALRSRIGELAGWDLLLNLENAFVPLTAPLSPGMNQDWLYTGRAFSISSLPINAGWMVVTREDFGAQTYWRIFIRTRYQDGSQGKPLSELPWNLNARTSGDPRSYEQGGALVETLLQGYWVDVTELAAAYGWQRLPALNTWRSAYSAARFNEFFRSDGLDWTEAMLDIYPDQAITTPTVIYPTRLPSTATPTPTKAPTPTRTPKPRNTMTPSPTP